MVVQNVLEKLSKFTQSINDALEKEFVKYYSLNYVSVWIYLKIKENNRWSLQFFFCFPNQLYHEIKTAKMLL